MPLPMVHLGVAKNLLEKLKINDVSGFYLGSISPDAVHMRKNSTGDDKNVSHLNLWVHPNLEISKKNIEEFISKNLSAENCDFYIGYGVHVLTDTYWRVRHIFDIKYAEDKTPVQDQIGAYYNDTDKLDFELYKKYGYRPEIWDYLSKSKAVGIDGLVSADEVSAWNQHILHWYDSGESQHKNPIKYITYDDLISFMDDAAVKIYEYIGNIVNT